MFECQIHFAKVPCQVSDLLSFSSVEFRCMSKHLQLYWSAVPSDAAFFWQNPPIIVLFRTWGKVWNGSISKSKVCLKKKLDFSCHTTQECFNCLVFFLRQTLIVRTSEMFTLIVILCLFFHGQQAPLFPTH